MRIPRKMPEKIILAERLVCAFDFDGTLAEITPMPNAARVSKKMEWALSALEKHAKIVVVSSRPVAFLKQRLRFLKRAEFYGLHGLETPEGTTRIPPKEVRKIEVAEEEIAGSAHPFEGAWIERKKTGFTVHYRAVKPRQEKKLEEMLLRSIEHRGLRFYRGKKSVEVVARYAPDKCSTLKGIIGRLPPDSVLLFFGDDGEDEEAFKALESFKNAFCVAVGRKKTAADASVRDVEGVEALIQYIIKIRRRRTKGHALARRIR